MTFGHHTILVPKLSFFCDFRGLSPTRGKGVKRPDGLAREKLFSVCCMLYGVCVFGALELNVAAACCLLLLPGT